jgi:hypothetical protein
MLSPDVVDTSKAICIFIANTIREQHLGVDVDVIFEYILAFTSSQLEI